MKVCFFHSSDNARRNDVALHDAAENVHENPFNIAVAEDDFERGGDLFLACTTADIEKIRGAAAIMLDDVHRRHREAGTVHQARDVPVELDVIEIEFAG